MPQSPPSLLRPVAAATRPVDTFEALDRTISRIRAEYREMPGLQLTCEQAARLLGIELPDCARLLGALVEEGFLFRTRKARYQRADFV